MAKKHKDIITEKFIFHVGILLKRFWNAFVVSFLLFALAGFLPVLRDKKLSTLDFWGYATIFGYAIIASFVTWLAKKSEKQKTQTELDLQYMLAFAYSGKSVFDSHKIMRKNDPVSITEYLTEVLCNISDSVSAILEANAITDNKITVNLMIERPSVERSQRLLEMIVFAPANRLGRNTIKLNLTKEYDETTLPGAPTAFLTKTLVYIADTTDEKYKVEEKDLFKKAKYKSFFSIPVYEEDFEDKEDGTVFAVLNVDSPNINHFVDQSFIEGKIYPALYPQLALIKVLRKTGQI